MLSLAQWYINFVHNHFLTTETNLWIAVVGAVLAVAGGIIATGYYDDTEVGLATVGIGLMTVAIMLVIWPVILPLVPVTLSGGLLAVIVVLIAADFC